MQRWSICRYGNSINYYPEKNHSHVSNVGLFLILTRNTSTSVLCAMQIWPCSFIQAYKTCLSKGNGVNRLQSQCNSKKKQHVPLWVDNDQSLSPWAQIYRKKSINMIPNKGLLLTKKKMSLKLSPDFNRRFIVAFVQEETMVCIQIWTTPTPEADG